MAPADIDSAGLILQYRTLKVLARNYNITVVSTKEDYGTNSLKGLGIKAIKITNNQILYSLLEKESFDIAIISWWDTAKPILGTVKKFVSKVILNTIDVEFVRKNREGELDKTIDLSAVYRRREEELAIYKQVDKVWFVTDQDWQHVLSYESSVKGDVLPIIQKIPLEFPRKNIDYNSMYFLGNYIHKPNLDAATILCRDIFPEIQKKHQNAQLCVMGKWSQALQIYNKKAISVTGIVYDLEKRLSRMQMCIANLRWGAGLKGKVCEAMSYGIPVIGSSIAFEGLAIDSDFNSDKQNAILANSNDEVINAVDQLYGNKELGEKIGRNSRALMHQFSELNVKDKLVTSIESLFKKPPVISILTYNKVEITKRCLDSVIKNTPEPYILVVSDNGSSDDTLAYLNTLKRVRVIDNGSNLGFARGHNQVIKMYEGHDIVLMNNDVEMPSNWLSELQFFIQTRKLGAASPAIININGLDVGAVLDRNARGRSIIEKVGQITDTKFDWITGSCLYLKADTIKQAGLLDENYPLYYEDVDYCKTMNANGLQFDCCRDIQIVHRDSASSTPSEKKQLLEQSRQRFCNKWGYLI